MGKNSKESYQLNGLLDRGCSFEGKLMFDGTVQINGDFRGEILSDGTLVVGPEANINARIQVDAIIVDGKVQGIVEAKRRIELHNGSRLVANIVTPVFAIEEGGVFHGQCQMLEQGKTAEETTQPAKQDAIFVEEGEDSLMM